MESGLDLPWLEPSYERIFKKKEREYYSDIYDLVVRKGPEKAKYSLRLH